jgi:AraC-like DNA-binding protein
MKSRLHDIKNWLEQSRQANWCAATLAKNCGVSLRTLERYFKDKMGKSPKKWLCEQRKQQGSELMQVGSSVKETAAQLGYKHATHFSRDFKQLCGHCATAKPAPPQPERMQLS